MSGRKKLGEILVEAKVITPQQLQSALQAQLIYGGRLGTNLVELDYLSEEFLAEFLARKCGTTSVRPEETAEIPPEAIESISAELAVKFNVVPLRRDRKILEVAMLDPMDLRAIDELAFSTGCQIRPRVAAELLMVHLLERYYAVPRKQRYIRLAPEHPRPVAPPPPPPRNELTPVPSPLAPPQVGELPDLSSSLTPTAPAGPTPGGVVPGATSPVQPSVGSRPTTLAEFVRGLADSDDVPSIAGHVVRMWDPHFDGKILVLAPRGADELGVVLATGPQDFRSRAREIRVSLVEPNVLQLVFEAQRPYRGTPRPSEENVSLLTAFEEDPAAELVIRPLLHEGRVVLLFVAVAPRAGVNEATFRFFDLLFDKAAIAYEIVLLKRRLLRVPEG